MDKFTQRLVEIAKRKNELKTEIENAKDETTLEALDVEVRGLNEEAVEIKRQIAEAELKSREGKNKEMTEKELKILNKYDTPEYRSAFKDYIMGVNDDAVKMRTDYKTTVSDVSAIVPMTVMNIIIQELKAYGSILPLVTFSNYKGGVQVPIAGAKPVAEWVNEGETSSRNRQKVNEYVQFSYYKLQVQVSITLMASVVSLESWEQLVGANIAEALAVAIESSIINGNGSGKPKGLLNDIDKTGSETTKLIPNKYLHSFDAEDDANYQGWLDKLIGNMPLAYEGRNNVILVNKSTWTKYMAGMMDEYGQPVARTNFGITGAPTLTFMGARVILRAELPSYDLASANDIFLIYGDLSSYFVNTNLEMTMRTYIDEDTDEIVRKSTAILDGKAVDKDGWVFLKKA